MLTFKLNLCCSHFTKYCFSTTGEAYFRNLGRFAYSVFVFKTMNYHYTKFMYHSSLLTLEFSRAIDISSYYACIQSHIYSNYCRCLTRIHRKEFDLKEKKTEYLER